MKSASSRTSTAWALVCSLGLGCALAQTTDGTSLRDRRIEEIVIGESTRSDVADLLGSPDEIIYSNRDHDPLFERAYLYARTKRKTTFFSIILFSAARSDANSDRVVVFFDDDGVVEDVAARLDMDKPRYGGPWGGND